jgi:hypothetical protein
MLREICFVLTPAALHIHTHITSQVRDITVVTAIIMALALPSYVTFNGKIFGRRALQ